MRLIDADKLMTFMTTYDYNGEEIVLAEDIANAPTVKAIPMSMIKELGEDLKIAQKGIIDKKVLIGFNMAIALCNKHIGEGVRT